MNEGRAVSLHSRPAGSPRVTAAARSRALTLLPPGDWGLGPLARYQHLPPTGSTQKQLPQVPSDT